MIKILTVRQAAQFCKDNQVATKYWDCGYVLEAILEVDHNIKLPKEDSWKELEDLLHYNAE